MLWSRTWVVLHRPPGLRHRASWSYVPPVPGLTFTSPSLLVGRHTPSGQTTPVYTISHQEGSQPRREQSSNSSHVLLWRAVHCFHSWSLNIRQSLRHYTPTLENHVIHLRCKQCPLPEPWGRGMYSEDQSVAQSLRDRKESGPFPQCCGGRGGQLDITGRPGMLMNRCFFSISILLQGSREIW